MCAAPCSLSRPNDWAVATVLQRICSWVARSLLQQAIKKSYTRLRLARKDNLITIFLIFEVHDDILPRQSRDLRDTLGNCTAGLESQLICYPSKRNPVVSRVLRFVYKLNDCIWRVGADQVDELFLLEILVGCTDIKNTAADGFDRRT